MPPNRKQHGVIVDTLNIGPRFVQTSKFAPLTAATPTSNPTTATADPSKDATTSESTPLAPQDLANRALIERILLEERLRLQFSADHLVESILQEQQQAGKTSTVHNDATSTDEREEYWNMPATKNEATIIHASNNHQSYWDWPSMTPQQKQEQEHDETIRQILQAEEHRQLFTVEHLEANLVQDAARRNPRSDQPQPSLQDDLDSYWQWNTAVETVDGGHTMTAGTKAALIDSILRDEEQRQLFTVDHLQKNLIQAAATLPASSSEQDDYWAGF